MGNIRASRHIRFLYLPMIALITAFLFPLINDAHANDITIKEGITYAIVDGTELKLDLASPTGEGPFPAIVYIHGGGWYEGDRQRMRPEIEAAARHGYVAAAISYRLMDFDEKKRETTTATDNFPAQVHDVKAAVRFLRAHAKEYNIDPQYIGAVGGSAGGHLSLMLGLTDSKANLEGQGGNLNQSSRVQAVVNLFGPTEMTSCYKNSIVPWIFRLFLDGTPQEVPKRYQRASPITYVSKDDPPVLTIHGDRDLLVPVEQAKKLDKAMTSAGASHTLLILEDQGHGFKGESAKQAHKAAWKFLDKHLKQ